MYFKRLEIFGFKSFADKTVLDFEPGITAVVGPNGCGKSNIFDAVRWVLGEQSVKELRGSDMEDVIFNGTAQKPSLGFAEVSLTLSNENHVLPVEYEEVTITRRLFRSGESEYLLNKTAVRLKDIQELLMGTGIGAEAYSLIQQGKVDLVVSARPEDRRMIFDEAAGITKYKAKKKEALNRLRDTENNLLRVNDITGEVKRQIASIERQANKARRYKEELKKLEDLEVRLAKDQLDSFTQEKKTIEAKVQSLQTEEQSFVASLKETGEGLTGQMNCLEQLEQRISNVQTEEVKRDGQMTLHHRQIGFNDERIEGLIQNAKRLMEQKEQTIERCRIQQAKIEDLKNGLSIVKATLQVHEQMLKIKGEDLQKLEISIKEAKRAITDHEEKILTLTSSQVNLRNELTDVMKEMQGNLARKRRLEMERGKVGSEMQQVDGKLKEVDDQIKRFQEAMERLQMDKDDNEQMIDTLRSTVLQLEQNINALEKKSLALQSQKDFIEKLHVQYHDIPDPIVEGRLMTKTLPLEYHTGIIGKVKDVRGPNLEQWYEIICETKFIELDPQQISIHIAQITEEINDLLGRKEALAEKITEQARILRQLDEEIRQQEKSHSVIEAQRKDISEEKNKLSGELELVDVELTEVRDLLAAAQKKEEELNYRLETVDQDIVWSQKEIRDRQDWIAVHLLDKEETTVAIAQLKTEIESEKDKLKTLGENEKMFAQDLDRWLEEIKKHDNEISLQELKKEEYRQENEALKQKIAEFKQQQESFGTVLKDYEQQKTDMGEKIEALRARMVLLQEDVDRVRESLHDQQLKDQEILFAERAINDRLRQTYKIDLDEILKTQAQEQLQAPGRPEVQDSHFLQQEIEQLRKRCEAFGTVNLVAIEEYEELKQRFEFLTKQQSDLLEAKSQLLDTISKINRSTRQIFMDTFTKVGEEFRHHFRTLFGGGEAQLILLDPENVLESGIEIIARPPGKKLQNISLLSGGEKTLTAIALIFGLFKVRPSPFCVLDEIDAALDDSNVGRFGYLLRDFAKIAQFIIITHNKSTIATSNVIYGITMPETGISSVVSVKFSDEGKKKVEEVPAGV